MLRMFGPGLALCLAAQLVGAFLVQEKTWSRFAGAGVTVPSAPPAATATSNTTTVTTPNSIIVTTTITPTGPVTAPVGSLQRPPRLVTLAMSVATTLMVVANLAALCWFGMWMGLNSRNANLATLQTIVFVQIIPWFV